MSGLFGGSKSSQESTTNQTDNRVGASGKSVALGGKKNRLKINNTTPAAWELGEAALEFSDGTVSKVLSAANDLYGEAFAVAGEAGARADAQAAAAFDLASTHVEDAADKTRSLVGMVSVIGAASLVAVKVWGK